MTNIVGYVASVVLMISFSMRDVTKLRIVNCLSCICFIIYGFLLATAWPVIISNAFVLCANLWHLRQSRTLTASEQTKV